MWPSLWLNHQCGLQIKANIHGGFSGCACVTPSRSNMSTTNWKKTADSLEGVPKKVMICYLDGTPPSKQFGGWLIHGEIHGLHCPESSKGPLHTWAFLGITIQPPQSGKLCFTTGLAMAYNQWEFQDLKMEVRYCTISQAICCWDIPLHKPYIGLIYGRYGTCNFIRFLKLPLIQLFFGFFNQQTSSGQQHLRYF